MDMDICRFEINGFSVGLQDRNDVLKGKKNDYINACNELWDYLNSDDFYDDVSAEHDYKKLCEVYERCMTQDNILIPMEELDYYCDVNDISTTSFLDNMDKFFNTYDDYFVDSSKYVSGNCLSDFELDMTQICRAIISRPLDLIEKHEGIMKTIENEKLLAIFEKMKQCLNLE